MGFSVNKILIVVALSWSLFATFALAQSAPPDPEFINKAVGILQTQRNAAQDALVVMGLPWRWQASSLQGQRETEAGEKEGRAREALKDGWSARHPQSSPRLHR